jgi:transcriptional regulator with XRE-family HTH domain
LRRAPWPVNPGPGSTSYGACVPARLKKHFIACKTLDKALLFHYTILMAKKNELFQSAPFAVESAINKLGADLRTARLRRGFTIGEAAGRIGAGVRAVSDAEHGKATTAIAVYAALLWLYGMHGGLEYAADPLSDAEGLRLEAGRAPARARKSRTGRGKELDNDF